MVKVIFEKLSKYVLLPGIDIEVNINGKVVALNGEIIVRVETPDDFQYNVMYGKGGSRGGDYGAGLRPPNTTNGGENVPCAINLRAEVNLQDVIDDCKEIENCMKSATEK